MAFVGRWCLFNKADDGSLGKRIEVVDDTSDDYLILRDKVNGVAWVQYRGGRAAPVSCHPCYANPVASTHALFGKHARVRSAHGRSFDTRRCVVKGKYGEIARQHCKCGGEHTRFVPRYAGEESKVPTGTVLSREYTCNAANYCEDCAPDGVEPEAMPSEVDSPLTCEACSRPLYCTLTNYGVKALLESIMETLDAGHGSWDHVVTLEGDYYNGRRQVEVMRDMVTAANLLDYDLSDTERWLVGYFLEATKPPQERFKKPSVGKQAHGIVYERKKRIIRRPKPVDESEGEVDPA